MSITTRSQAARRIAFVTGLFLAMLAPVTLSVTTLNAVAQEVPDIYLYVNDLANPRVLLNAERNALTNLCYDIDDISTAEVAILIVNTTLPLGIDMFAVETFQKNGIGKAGLDNGLLIVVSVDERQWRIEVGYGLEGILNDAKVGRMGDNNLTPALLAGDYYVGLYDTTYELGTEIVNNYIPPNPNQPPPQPWVLDWRAIWIAVAVFIFLSVITKGRVIFFLPNLFKRGGFGGGKSGGGGAKRGY